LSSVSGSRILCVGAIVTDGHGRLLLIQRGHEPGKGLWSLPGGRVEPGETDAEALVREMEEETGLTVAPGRLIGQVDRPGRAGDVFDIRDYAATVTGGTLRPGDDAADARWVARGDMAVLPMTEGLVEALTEWGVLGEERSLLSCFSVPSLREPFVPDPESALRMGRRLSGGSGCCGRGGWTADLSQAGQVFEGGLHAGEEPVERGLHAGIGGVIADTADGVQPGPVQPAREVRG
jgi:8-oxo-dGTP diphosphatase